MAKNKGMKEMDILDIGGGFSMSSTDPEKNFDYVAPKINQMLKEYFPGDNDVFCKHFCSIRPVSVNTNGI